MPTKKKTTRNTPVTTADLAGDAKNPRRISEKAAAGLAKSIEQFGDLSGITFNTRTGELVTGHQRVTQIREKHGDTPIEIDPKTGRGWISTGDEHFAVRIVDWSPAVQRAANVAANNARIQGQFADVADYLEDIQTELDAEMPGVLNDVLLSEILSTDTKDSSAAESKIEIPELYQVVVECTDENHQRKIYEKLVSEGLTCKVLTL